MTDTRLLKARMVAKGITPADLASAQGWKCVSTAYRKLNNKSEFTVPEAMICIQLLDIDRETASAIFFA